MFSAKMKTLLLSIIFVSMLEHASGLTETEILSLLENDNGPSNTISAMLRDQKAFQNQTTLILSEMANAQADIASVLNLVVRMLQDMNECFSRPCQNQGQCVNSDNGYTCECQAGWTGANCEKDECTSAPCQNGGLCIEGVNNYTCQCVDGWTGNICEIDIDECASALCLNDGQCIDGVNQYICQCVSGWTGASCEINVDECVSNPCKNGGQCIDGVNNYNCQCLAGNTGILCETSPTCQPGDFLCDDGSCISNEFVCDRFSDCDNGTDEEQTLCAMCPYKFLCTNGRCVDMEDICDGTDDCRDNSDEDQICVDMATPSVTGFNTTSVTLQWNEPPPELTGTPRREITKYAVTFTSQDSGELQVMFVPAGDTAVYTVTGLAPGTTYEMAVDVVINTEGQGEQTYDIGIPTLTATTHIDECSSAPCQNGGECITGVNQYICQCISGWIGDSCKINIDECASSQCQNGGLCIDGVNQYICQCLWGWTGNLCETKVDECSSTPCQNGGQCIDGVNQYTCQCTEGWTGDLCEISPTCQPGNFLCDDGRCIPNEWVCDNYPDCDNGTDEEESTCAVCPFKFLCTNGRCTELEHVCDGTNQCRDNSDEDLICVDISTISVHVVGAFITLQCNALQELTGNPQRNITQYAVTVTKQGGGESQMFFVTAEVGAAYTVTGLEPATTYKIEVDVAIDTEGQGEQTYDIAIPTLTVNTTYMATPSVAGLGRTWITLQWNESTPDLIGTPQRNITQYVVTATPQGGGESRLVYVAVEGELYYMCSIEGLLPDTTYDIGMDVIIRTEGQGEQAYDIGIPIVTVTTHPPCEADLFLCYDGSCIPSNWVCDEFQDCEHGTDEKETTCITCPYKFLCSNGRCVDLSDVCDGTNNCEDNSDEDQICLNVSTSAANVYNRLITLQLNALLELTGNPQRNITQYVVSVTRQDGGQSQVVFVPALDDTAYNVTGLQPGTDYVIELHIVIDTEGQGEQTYDIGIPKVTIKITTCLDYLGMENGDIPDGNIQASTYTRNYYPRNARLNGNTFWMVDYDVSNPWIQADIGYQTYVSAVATQGSTDGGWTTSFKVSSFSMTTSNPETYIRDSDDIKVFQGNTDASSIVISTFPEPVFARIIRITCLERGPNNGWYWRIRFEILGCKQDG